MWPWADLLFATVCCQPTCDCLCYNPVPRLSSSLSASAPVLICLAVDQSSSLKRSPQCWLFSSAMLRPACKQTNISSLSLSLSQTLSPTLSLKSCLFLLSLSNSLSLSPTLSLTLSLSKFSLPSSFLFIGHFCVHSTHFSWCSFCVFLLTHSLYFGIEPSLHAASLTCSSVLLAGHS